MWSNRISSSEYKRKQEEADRINNSQEGRLKRTKTTVNPFTGQLEEENKSYDERHADLSKYKYNDWKNNNEQYILDFSKKVESGSNVDRAVNQATNAINTGYGLADAARERRLASMGVQRSAEQIAADNLKSSLNQTAGLVSAENRARRSAKDRDAAMISGLSTANPNAK